MAVSHELTKVLVVKLERPNWEVIVTTNTNFITHTTASARVVNDACALLAISHLFWHGDPRVRTMIRELCELVQGEVTLLPATTMTVKEYPYVSQEVCHASCEGTD